MQLIVTHEFRISVYNMLKYQYPHQRKENKGYNKVICQAESFN